MKLSTNHILNLAFIIGSRLLIAGESLIQDVPSRDRVRARIARPSRVTVLVSYSRESPSPRSTRQIRRRGTVRLRVRGERSTIEGC